MVWIHESNVQQTNKIIRSKNKSTITVKKWDENKDKWNPSKLQFNRGGILITFYKQNKKIPHHFNQFK